MGSSQLRPHPLALQGTHLLPAYAMHNCPSRRQSVSQPFFRCCAKPEIRATRSALSEEPAGQQRNSAASRIWKKDTARQQGTDRPQLQPEWPVYPPEGRTRQAPVFCPQFESLYFLHARQRPASCTLHHRCCVSCRHQNGQLSKSWQKPSDLQRASLALIPNASPLHH